jgi:hypothetical protein
LTAADTTTAAATTAMHIPIPPATERRFMADASWKDLVRPTRLTTSL